MWQLYLFLVGPVVLIFIFKYIPIYGLYMAFVDFRIGKNILSSPWNNFENFKLIFASTDFARYFLNTNNNQCYENRVCIPCAYTFLRSSLMR